MLLQIIDKQFTSITLYIGAYYVKEHSKTAPIQMDRNRL